VNHKNRNNQLEILTYTLGPAQANAYLVGDPISQSAVVIDPVWNGDLLLREAEKRHWRITYLWLTHAHFDHFGGAAQIADSSSKLIEVALHTDDQPLWRALGGASIFGFPEFDPGPEPTIPLVEGMHLQLGDHTFIVHHTPGHTPGHVIFVLEDQQAVFCGDLIFKQGVGRTDLPGGDWPSLENSIHQHILTLADEFVLFPGHGPETTVGDERIANPFVGKNQNMRS